MTALSTNHSANARALLARPDLFDFLNEALRYEPDTGFLFWRERPDKHFPSPLAARRWNSRCAGKRAFMVKTKGYMVGAVGGGHFMASRIIWMMVHREIPPGDIDHISGVRDDNRLENLRSVTRTENRRNAARSKNNKSGVCGVWKMEAWVAHITVKGKHYDLGRFKTKEAAVAARKAAEVKYGFHKNHGRDPIAIT